MSSPVLSIVMPVLDEGERIGAAIDALAPLVARGAELIVVDGGSRDGTADRARARARAIARAVRNASPAEMSFCRLAAQLPGRRPTEASTLREWRAYAAAVESLKPAITKTGVRF